MEILAIAFVKGDKNGRAWLSEFAKNRGINWTLIPTTEEWYGPPFEAYNVHYIPFNVLLDADGKVVATGVHGERIGEAIADALKRKAKIPPSE